MTPRFRLALVAVSLGFVGCSDSFNAGPIAYTPSERLATDLNEKPKLREAVQKALTTLFGEDPQHIKVPAGSGLPNGGIYLANFKQVGQGEGAITRPIVQRRYDKNFGKYENETQAGGYALYRKHCLHCHGVSGAGDGPTAMYLYPRPRDYRMGLYKFTSTTTGAKPTRDDLRKTIRYGLHGSSMPAFEALMTNSEMEQVIDYMTFLSMRGEIEKTLIDEVAGADDKDAATALTDETVAEIATSVFEKWKVAETQVLAPAAARVPATKESVERGRNLFLGLNKTGNKVECAGCHGPKANGKGASFIEEQVFQDVVFRRKSVDAAIARLFRNKLDAEAASHGDSHATTHEEPMKSPASEIVTFLSSNSDITARLRKDHNLFETITTDKDFQALLADTTKADQIAQTVEKVLPEISNPVFRTFWRGKFDLWTKGSLDDWGNPIRPANLNLGVYKGGRRPIDIYWRLAKGINGAKMPSHVPTLTPEQIWDVVNFVLTLPYEPELLKVNTPAAAGHVPSVAQGETGPKL